MEVSRLTTRGINKNYLSRSRRLLDLLRFIQAEAKKNPRFLKDTTAKNISYAYLNHLSTQGETRAYSGVVSAFDRLLNSSVLVKTPMGHQRSNFRINYLAPGLPDDILENMTDEEQEFVKETLNKVKERQTEGKDAWVDQAGAVTSKDKTPEEEPVEPEGPVEEPVEELKPVKEPEEELVEETVEKPVAVVAQPAVTTQPVETPTVVAPVEVKRQGNNLTLTINISLNM